MITLLLLVLSFRSSDGFLGVSSKHAFSHFGNAFVAPLLISTPTSNMNKSTSRSDRRSRATIGHLYVRAKNGVSVDDAIAAMGLTQVKKKVKKKPSNTTNRNAKDSKYKASKNSNPAATTSIREVQKKMKKKNVQQEILSKGKKTFIKSPSPEISSASSSLQDAKDISLSTQLNYAREGHASIRNLIPREVIEEIYQDLKAYSTNNKYRQKGEDSAPFLQFYNTWRDLPSVKRLATSPLLCQAACTMMGMDHEHQTDKLSSRSLRLYQDSVFIKRKNKDGITPWHIDGRMMPFDTSNIITFWIPLHAIPSIDDGGTGLLFINKSHSDFSLPYWNGRGTDFDDDVDEEGGVSYSYNAYENLTNRYGIENVGDDRIVDNNPGVIGHYMPLDAGDCTVHNGWTMHCANGNKKNLTKRKKKRKDANDDNHNHNTVPAFQTRYAIAISYVDSHAEVRHDIPGVGRNVNRNNARGKSNNLAFLGDAEDRASYAEWIGDVLPRSRFKHDLLPDVWPPPS